MLRDLKSKINLENLKYRSRLNISREFDDFEKLSDLIFSLAKDPEYKVIIENGEVVAYLKRKWYIYKEFFLFIFLILGVSIFPVLISFEVSVVVTSFIGLLVAYLFAILEDI